MRLTTCLARLRDWFSLPIRYDWLRSYLEARGLERLARHSAAALCLACALLWSLMVIGETHAMAPLGIAVAIGSAIICTGFSILWAVCWPSAAMSKAFVLALAVLGALLFLSQRAHPVDGAGIVGFLFVNSYAACVHTRRFLAAPIAIGVAVTGVYFVRVTAEGDLIRALSDCAFYLVAIVVTPMCFQYMVYLLSSDADDSDFDPLTALLNRRGFDRAVRQMVGAPTADRTTDLSFVMIDLDRFKSINDTFGHTVGDQVLIMVGEILRRACRGSATFARIGGEEFIVAYAGDRSVACAIAEQVRRQLLDTRWCLTASFGIASAPLLDGQTGDTEWFTEHLLRVADQLMYTAKRAGGDRIESIEFGGEYELRQAG